MKAWRNFGGSVIQVEIDTDIHGNPIYPPDTTIDPKPEAKEAHYVTVVGKEWVQIPITIPFVSFETKKDNKLKSLKNYSNWYLNQPVTHNNVLFDSDEISRNRLVQTILMYQTNNYLPPFWISTNKTPIEIKDISDLISLSTTIQTSFSKKFFEINDIRQKILAAQDEKELNEIEIPVFDIN